MSDEVKVVRHYFATVGDLASTAEDLRDRVAKDGLIRRHETFDCYEPF
jgi:hypothetical protein